MNVALRGQVLGTRTQEPGSYTKRDGTPSQLAYYGQLLVQGEDGKAEVVELYSQIPPAGFEAPDLTRVVTVLCDVRASNFGGTARLNFSYVRMLAAGSDTATNGKPASRQAASR